MRDGSTAVVVGDDGEGENVSLDRSESRAAAIAGDENPSHFL